MTRRERMAELVEAAAFVALMMDHHRLTGEWWCGDEDGAIGAAGDAKAFGEVWLEASQEEDE